MRPGISEQTMSSKNWTKQEKVDFLVFGTLAPQWDGPWTPQWIEAFLGQRRNTLCGPACPHASHMRHWGARISEIIEQKPIIWVFWSYFVVKAPQNTVQCCWSSSELVLAICPTLTELPTRYETNPRIINIDFSMFIFSIIMENATFRGLWPFNILCWNVKIREMCLFP